MTSDKEAIIEGLRSLIRVTAQEIRPSIEEVAGYCQHEIRSWIDLIESTRMANPSPPPVRSNPDRFLTSQELADCLGIPVGSVLRLTRQGDIPALRVGHLYRYNLEEVIKALATEDESNA